jgi:hypothetical protein
MSGTAHMENLTDHDTLESETAGDQRPLAGGQLASVGRRHRAALAAPSVGEPVSVAADQRRSRAARKAGCGCGRCARRICIARARRVAAGRRGRWRGG